MTKLNASARNAFFMQQVRTIPPYSIRVAQNYRYFATKKVRKTCQRKLRKLSSRSNQSSTFAIFGGSKMSLQKLSERQHDFNNFLRRDKVSQKNPNSSKLQNFRLH